MSEYMTESEKFMPDSNVFEIYARYQCFWIINTKKRNNK